MESEIAPGSLLMVEEQTMVQLETVLYLQQLILFTGNVARPGRIVAVLSRTLQSKQPTLRSTSAATLRHLAERQPLLDVAGEDVRHTLFEALDTETNSSVSDLIRATLLTLLESGASIDPLSWLNLFEEVLLAQPPKQYQPQQMEQPQDDSQYR
eukprot:TRINITY_DN81882_c0_g1_i1.p2 TRINITY_DN81882_c0_g1~~TRINITY_DN81882_c0_g1_i1.p2  ORF type:complete len:179 (+),score=32.82 TRINITY_DN81882_c0_g1_i1:78-539(+)